MLIIHAGWNNLTDCLRVEPKEKRHRIARVRLTVIYPVDCRFEFIIREALKEVPNVDYECSFNWAGVNPLILGRQYLQAAGVVLPEKSETLDVGVGSNANVNI